MNNLISLFLYISFVEYFAIKLKKQQQQHRISMNIELNTENKSKLS